MLIDLAVDLASLIEATAVFHRVTVTAREPEATDDCSAAYVWGVRIYDSDQPLNARGDDAGCYYRRTYELAYRVDFCHQIRADGRELSAAEALAEATQMYDTADAVWCAITAAASNGTLFASISACEDIAVGDLVFTGQGDRNSANGTLKVTQPCDTALS